MASGSSSPHVLLPINGHATTGAKSSGMSGVQTRQVSAVRIPLLKMKSGVRNKIYEDRERGIVCYREDDGEVVCEGLDEGPRYHPPEITGANCQSGELQKHGSFRRRPAQLVEAVDLCSSGTFLTVNEDDGDLRMQLSLLLSKNCQ